LSTTCPDDPAGRRTVRRARPQLGTLVEVGVANLDETAHGRDAAAAAIDAAFARIASIEQALTRFDPLSEIGRFNDAAAGTTVEVGDDARIVLNAAAALGIASDGLFDVSLGTGADGWVVQGTQLRKRRAGVRLDLGGIAKGHAVDAAVEALRGAGIAAGWVNAGGDLRVFGALALPIDLRDEATGGVRRFAVLHEGAFATSWIACPPSMPASGTKAPASGAPDVVARHASVAAERCLWADALTKVVALAGDAQHALMRAHRAQAWLH
jgi:thiamine biosynthesis lipoprotein